MNKYAICSIRKGDSTPSGDVWKHPQAKRAEKGLTPAKGIRPEFQIEFKIFTEHP
jgi:hypothetical protein